MSIVMKKNPTVLAINPGHNGSVAVVKDGKLVFHIEEERLTRFKWDSNPFMGMKHALENYDIDVLVLGGTSPYPETMEWTGMNAYECFARKYNNDIEIVYKYTTHHEGHAATAFYNSGFDTAVALIVDGCGSTSKTIMNDNQIDIFEAESIFDCSYPNNIKRKYVSYVTNFNMTDTHVFGDVEKYLSDKATVVKVYEAVTDYLGFPFIEAGKTMGLSSYGKYDEKFSNLFGESKDSYRIRGNKNYIKNFIPIGCLLDSYSYNIVSKNPEWHKNSDLVTEDQKNLSWMVQQQSQEIIGNLIEHAVKETGQTNVVISGGYGLNCVANYYYKKRFPNLNFYIEPVSNDGGTTVGLAKLVWAEKTNLTVKDPLKNIYLGLPQSAKIDFDKIPSNFVIQEVNYSDIAKLIREQNIVCIFQGRSESGPRALGNRSIVFDPTVKNGKDLVNKVKGREWFRPFAGSILEEHANEYFDMAGLEKSPFMMYAVDVLEDKQKIIPCITHVDNTCRIQTVSKEDNLHYYNLISAFKEVSGVPILFNTSFNLAGDPLVETFDDALNTLMRSDMKYLYLPEHGKLLEKRK